jgi:hypothetical protein
MIIRTTLPKGQYIRSERTGAALGVIRPTDRLTVSDQYRSALGTSAWIPVERHGVKGIALAYRLIEDITADWGDLHASVGVHGPGADNHHWHDGVNYQQIVDARIETVKLLCAGDIGGEIVQGLHARGVRFVMARVYAPLTSKQSGAEVMREFGAAIALLYAAGVRYFEIANEPNLYNGANGSAEGMGVVWNNGYELADWWMSAAAYLKALFPDIKLGFPAMSPGDAIEGFRYSPSKMLAEADLAIQQADWMAFHTYWHTQYPQQAIDEIAAFASRYPHKLIAVTEFSNPNPYLPPDNKGAQYVQFYQLAKQLPRNIGPLICFVLDNSGFPPESWRGTPIARIVGAR